MLDLVEKGAGWVGLTGVHWSQFGIKEERQIKNGRPSQELHGGDDCFHLIFVIWFYYIRMVVCWLSHCL